MILNFRAKLRLKNGLINKKSGVFKEDNKTRQLRFSDYFTIISSAKIHPPCSERYALIRKYRPSALPFQV